MASYEKREDGSWSVRFRIKDKDKTVMKRLSGFDKKSKAETAYREFIAEHEKALERAENPLKAMTFDSLISEYLNNKKGRIKPSSLYDLKNVIDFQIRPYFKNMLVKDISPQIVLNWQNSLNDKQLSYQYKSNLRTHLSSIFRFACQVYNLINNPVSKVDGFRNLEPSKEMMFWTLEEFRKFIVVVDDEILKTFFSCLYFGGFRKGELFAVSWNDIDFDKNEITISKSITRKVEGEKFSITTPKNKSSNRTIKMPIFCIDLLKSIKAEASLPNDFVFGVTRPLSDNKITRAFQKYCTAADVKIIRLHDLRHSHASLLIEQGENVLMISKRLGHSDITQTLNTYSHLMPDKEQELVEKLDMLMSIKKIIVTKV